MLVLTGSHSSFISRSWEQPEQCDMSWPGEATRLESHINPANSLLVAQQQQHDFIWKYNNQGYIFSKAMVIIIHNVHNALSYMDLKSIYFYW